MKILFNHIRNLFLWTAGLVILAHSIIPHHHHYDLDLKHPFYHYSRLSENNYIACESRVVLHNEEENENTCCAFNTDILPSFSNDNLDLFTSLADLNPINFNISFTYAVFKPSEDILVSSICYRKKSSRAPPVT